MKAFFTLLAVFGLVILAGCSSYVPSYGLRAAVDRGDYANAKRELGAAISSTDRREREYILDRMRLTMVDLADGRPDAAEPVAFDTFMLLRRQGINDDATVQAAVFGEGGNIFWKGEPFEQAMAFTYVGMTYASLGQWDNARAAAQASLFQLKDFGENERGERKTTEDIAREAARRDERRAGSGDSYIDKGYTPTKTNFALGYLLNGVANLALSRADSDRRDEAGDNFREAERLAPGVRGATDALMSGRANTIFIVDYGRGPEKVRYGPDGALARFEPRMRSDARELLVGLGGSSPERAGVLTDVNRLAFDHMWNNFEDVRKAKSAIGDALVVGGAVVAGTSGRRDGKESGGQLAAGLGAVLAGIALKSSAAADLRHCEIMPQRVYAAAVMIDRPGMAVELQVEGDPGSRIVLSGLSPPGKGESVQLRYVRLPSGSPLPWATSGRTMYANDRTDERVVGDELPYILGGRCVRTPSQETLEIYKRGGKLPPMSLAELENLYRAEGIVWGDNEIGESLTHVLEGGKSLTTPQAGTAGYARLFGQEHPPYRPRSAELKRVWDQVNGRASAAGVSSVQPSQKK